MIRPPGPGRGTTTARGRQAFDAVGHDPAVDDAEAAGHRPRSAIEHGRRAAQADIAADDRILGVEDERTVGVDEFGEAALDLPIGLDRPVSVEVVGGDLGVDGDGRPPRQRRQLQLGQLVDDPVVRRQLGEPFHDRDPDVAAEDGRMRWIAGEDGGGEGRGRRLALRAGHADRRGLAQAQEQVGLADEGRGERVAAGPCRDEVRERSSEAWLGRRVVGRDRRGRRDEGGPRPGRRRVDVRPDEVADRRRPASSAIAAPRSAAGRPS